MKLLSIFRVFLCNKNDARTLGEFLTHAIDHIKNGGNFAKCETQLENGTCLEITIKRITTKQYNKITVE